MKFKQKLSEKHMYIIIVFAFFFFFPIIFLSHPAYVSFFSLYTNSQWNNRLHKDQQQLYVQSLSSRRLKT